MYRNDDPPTDEAAEAAAEMADTIHDALKTHLAAMTEDQQAAVEQAVFILVGNVYRDAYNDGMADASRYRMD